MRWTSIVALRFRSLFRRDRVERELDQELRFHLEEQVAANVRAGMDYAEARVAALRAFGGVAQLAEECRDARSVRWLEDLMHDLRYSLRMLLKSPGFTVVAVLTLALGIGANTAVFSVVNAVLLRPLPYDHPQQLVKIWTRYTGYDLPQNWVSEPEFWDMRDSLRDYSALAAYSTGGGANLTRNASEPLRVTTTQTSAELFPLLGVSPALGRFFNHDEDQPGRDKVVVLDYGFWTSQFAANPQVVGQSIQLNGETYTVLGVMPKGFNFGGDTNLWLPLALDRAKPAGRGSHYLEVIGRLRDGVTPAQAQGELDALVRNLAGQYPNNYGGTSGFGMFQRPLHEELVGDSRRSLLVLFAAVGFVLLIGCVNLANLLLARSSARSREIAVRTALGAGRGRLVRQLITESVVLAMVGGVCGVLLAILATNALRTLAQSSLPAATPISIDVRVLLFAAAISVLTGVLFGVAPALQLSRPQVAEALKDAARSSSGAAGQKMRSVLVVAEISMALMLLVGAGLLVRSLQRLLEVSPGFQAEHLLTARLSLPQTQYRDTTAINSFYRDVTQRLGAVPGVQAAGMGTILPMTGRHSSGSTYVEHTSATGFQMSPVFHAPNIEADQRFVTPGFFEAMRIPLLHGRWFTASDDANAPDVAIVDEEFAKRFWPDRDPIGERIATGAIPNSNPPVPRWRTVVGVVGHVKNDSLDQQGREQTYYPIAQAPFPVRSMYLAVRATGDPAALTSGVRGAVAGLDSTLPLYEVKTMDEWLQQSVAQRRFNMLLLVIFSALALLLASIGTYGVISYSVNQRTREIGIRMALGASRADVLRMIVGGGMRLTAIGIAIGAVLALLAARFLSTLLFGVHSTDPATFVGVAAILAVSAFAAAYLPARRATRVNPVVALRYE